MTNRKSLKGEGAALLLVALTLGLFIIGIPLVLLDIKMPRKPMLKKLIPSTFRF